jgi:hypothetical protein
MDGRIIEGIEKVFPDPPGWLRLNPGDPFRFAEASPERFSCGELRWNILLQIFSAKNDI